MTFRANQKVNLELLQLVSVTCVTHFVSYINKLKQCYFGPIVTSMWCLEPPYCLFFLLMLLNSTEWMKVRISCPTFLPMNSRVKSEALPQSL